MRWKLSLFIYVTVDMLSKRKLVFENIKLISNKLINYQVLEHSVVLLEMKIFALYDHWKKEKSWLLFWAQRALFSHWITIDCIVSENAQCEMQVKYCVT
jgi:hypothetical protein